jgi:hypothetical protein
MQATLRRLQDMPTTCCSYNEVFMQPARCLCLFMAGGDGLVVNHEDST